MNMDFRVDSFADYTLYDWFANRDPNNILYNRAIIDTPPTTRDDIIHVVELALEKSCTDITIPLRVIRVNDELIIAYSSKLFVRVEIGNNVSKVDMWYLDKNQKDSFLEYVSNEYSVIQGYVKWIYDSYNSDIIVPLDNDTAPIDEMYPFLNGKTVQDYYNEYLNSRSSILLLIGPPGTGKTTFIKGLIQYSKEIARVCYDDALLSKDSIFSDFIDSPDTFFILEDADAFLTSRKEGNTMMHKFLNVGDGLVKTRHKKMIFSTNIPSLKDVDPALIRPGRCFDILKFDLLDSTQARVLATKIGSNFVIEDGKKYSAAELFNSKSDVNTVNRSVGFL